MTESIVLPQTQNRATIYKELRPQIAALIEGETDAIANMANVSAALKQAFGFLWVGFYLVKGGELILGPFQGPVACTRIKFDEGVCGYSYTSRETIIVPNVDEFPGHIACSSDSKSEIVVPLFGNDAEVCGVLDVDSERINDFSEVDKLGLEEIVKILEEKI